MSADAGEGLLLDVIDNPADDTPRLILADWLDEHGRPERAEFIRVQCEAEALKRQKGWVPTAADIRGIEPDHLQALFRVHNHDRESRLEALSLREGELLGHWQGRWTTDTLNSLPDLHRSPLLQLCAQGATRGGAWPRDDAMFRFRRGFVACVTLPLAAWLGTPCTVCGGAGEHHSSRTGKPRPCSACRRLGFIGGHGPALVRAAPLEEVRLPGRVPRHDESGWYWRNGTPDDFAPDGIPFGLMNFGLWDKSRPFGRRLVRFPDKAAAEQALSAACLEWARSLPACEVRRQRRRKPKTSHG